MLLLNKPNTPPEHTGTLSYERYQYTARQNDHLFIKADISRLSRYQTPSVTGELGVHP